MIVLIIFAFLFGLVSGGIIVLFVMERETPEALKLLEKHFESKKNRNAKELEDELEDF